MQLFRIGWRLLVFVVVSCFFGFFLILSASYLYLGPKLPPASEITKVQLQTPLRIYTADHDLIAEFGSKRRIPLTYKQIPQDYINATLAAEDADFFEHGAVDFKGLARAAYELVRYQEIRSGGSTITMQVARNIFLTLNQTFLRKFNEIVLAIQIEHLLNKQQILTLYMNKIYLGHHAYGAAAAAEVYYGKSLAELDLAQVAMIAGLPKAPSAYNPINDPSRALIRRNWILGRMKLLGDITEGQYQLAAAQPVTARYHGSAPDVQASYVAEMARQQVLGLLGDKAYSSGIDVITTIDSKRQRAAVTAMHSGLQAYDKRHGWRGAIDHIDISKLPPLPQQARTAAGDTPKDSRVIAVSAASRVWSQQLRAYPEPAKLQVALVASVAEKSALLVLDNAKEVQIGWDAIEWANRYISANYRDHAPKKASQVIKPGDVVYLLPTSDNKGQPDWRLAQIPSIQGALVSLDPWSGAIQALQGGYSFQLSHFNRATQARRQPGSSFKPFIYTAGLEHGMTAATLLNDAPLVFSDSRQETLWRPTGDTSKFFGPTRLRKALYLSLNLASIRLLQQVGLDNAFNTLNQFHLPTSQFPKNLTIVLGSVLVTPMEMATAYGTFANSGYHVRPWLIKEITSTKGQVIWRAPKVELCDMRIDSNGEAHQPASSDCPDPASLPAVSEAIDSGEGLPVLQAQADPSEVPPRYRYRTLDKRTAWLMYSILQDVITRGTGRRARQLNVPGLAGKTGTTNDQVDAWFAGFTPDLVTTVWTGMDKPAPLGRYEQGAHTALPIWIDYMRKALPKKPIHHFSEPAGISAVLIDKKTGLRAHPGESNTMFEYFRNGNIPPFGASEEHRNQVKPQGIF